MYAHRGEKHKKVNEFREVRLMMDFRKHFLHHSTSFYDNLSRFSLPLSAGGIKTTSTSKIKGKENSKELNNDDEGEDTE